MFDFGANWYRCTRHADDGFYFIGGLFLGKKLTAILCVATGTSTIWADDYQLANASRHSKICQIFGLVDDEPVDNHIIF